MAKRQEKKSYHMGLLGTVGVIFVVLKLIGIIHWAWLWVLAPFWMPFLFWLFFIIIAFTVLWFSNRK